MEEIFDEITFFWRDVLNSKEGYTKKEARQKLINLALDLHSLKNEDELIRSKISSIIFGMLKTLESTPDRPEDLKVTSIIILEKSNPVYYIYDKTLLKEFTVKNPWFFKAFRKAEVIAENEFYMMIKDDYPSNLAYLANIILNKEKKVIHQRPNQGEWATAFLNSIKN